MKLKMLFVAVALFAVVAVSHAQGFNVGMYSYTPLTSSCSGGDPLSDTCEGTIYWDANNNGPDAADLPARIDGDPFGRANFNTFHLNSAEVGQDPGTFYFLENFTISTNVPAPSKYYVVVACGGVAWTSRVIEVLVGYQEVEMAPWTCAVTQLPCNEPNFVGIQTVGGRLFAPYHQCIQFCAGQTTTICLGPLAADERPHAFFFPGCLPPSFCDFPCPPTAIGMDPAGWVYNPASASWCTVVVAANDGCACFYLEYIESAENGSFDAVARDNSVELNWSTLAESNVARFDVMRKVSGHESFSLVGNVEAVNTTSGSSYTFVDNGAVNGTTYEYTLETVNVDGSREAWGTVVNATPSTDAAVITEYALHQNYPNPFNPSTNLVFDVVAENVVNLTVYNAMGQEVASLANGTMSAGRHTVAFDAANLTSGLYFYTVKIGNEFTATKKMLLVK